MIDVKCGDSARFHSTDLIYLDLRKCTMHGYTEIGYTYLLTTHMLSICRLDNLSSDRIMYFCKYGYTNPIFTEYVILSELEKLNEIFY